LSTVVLGNEKPHAPTPATGQLRASQKVALL